MSGQLFYEGVRIFIRNLSYLIAKSHAMKSNNSILIRSSVFAAVVVAAGLIAWQQPASANQQNRKDLITDTVPDKAKERDFEKQIRELQKAQQELDRARQTDWKKMQEEIQASIQKIDLKKMQEEIEKSMKELDLQKIKQEIQESLQKIDMEKMEQEMKASLENLKDADLQKQIREDMEKAKKEMSETLKKNKDIQKQIQEEMKKVNKETIRQEMEKVKVEMEKVKKEMSENKLNITKELDKAQEELKKAQKEMRDYQEMVYAMEADGLLNTKEDYTIEYRSNGLSINGKEQSAAVTAKYKKYFPKENTTITKKNDSLNIEVK